MQPVHEAKYRQLALLAQIVFSALPLTIGILLELDSPDPGVAIRGVVPVLGQLLSSFPDLSSSPEILLICASIAALLYLMATKDIRKHAIALALLSSFFGFSMVCGYSLDQTRDIAMLYDGAAQRIKSVWSFVSWSVVGFCVAALLFDLVDQIREKARDGSERNTSNFLSRSFDEHPELCTALVLAIFWMPVIVGYWPGLFMGDTSQQLAMWYGHDNLKSQMVSLLDPSVTLTTHYPVLHTALLGIFVNIGNLLGSAQAGYQAFTFIQVAIDIAVISYSMGKLQQLGATRSSRLFVLLLFAIIPWYPDYAVLATRETPFSCALLLMCIELVVIWKLNPNKLDWALLIIGALGTSLLRNGGIIFAIVGLAAGIIFALRQRASKQGHFLAIGLVISVTAFGCLNWVITPALHITHGSALEALSIPIQQTSRYVKYHSGDITPEEREVIDAVLVYEGLAERYKPIVSDPVKDYAATNRHEIDGELLYRFLCVWLEMGSRDPICYLKATLANYYGYFYVGDQVPNYYDPGWSAMMMEDVQRDLGLDIYPSGPEELSGFDVAYAEVFRRVPILSLSMTTAFWCWLLLLATVYAITRRLRVLAPALAALWAMLLVFLCGPCNGAFYNRYAYPIAYVLPFILALLVSPKATELNPINNTHKPPSSLAS